MTDDRLNEMIFNHCKWLCNIEGGIMADFSYTDLSNFTTHLSCKNLCFALFIGANLNGLTLVSSDFSHASFAGADLRGADLRDVNISHCDFRSANLDGVIINNSTDFYEADFLNAENVPNIPMSCPEEGSFIGWKKANGHIVKLEILADAKRSSGTGRKCRCDKARVLAIENLDGTPTELKEISSDYDFSFIYRIGQVSKVDNFCENRFRHCASGIHFFINRQEAVKYPN